MSETNTAEQAPAGVQHPKRVRAWLVAVGAAVALLVVGFGVAAAQSDSSTTTTTPPASPAPEGKPWGWGFRHHGGFGFRFGIHGEFTTRAPGGGYQTIATQVGEVTAVSSSSLTVKSEDGFSRTYAVDDNTLVNAGNEGIGDVQKGDQVRVVALVSDGKASAVDVRDLTQVGRLRDRWLPPRPSWTTPTTAAGNA